MDLISNYKKLFKNNEHPNELFHYTDWTGLSNIILTNSVRLTNSLYLNDLNETNEGYLLLLNLLELKFGSNFKDIKFFIDNLNKNAYGIYPSPDQIPYTFSLTSQKDQLSQWRGYGSNSVCFSIGFNSSILVKECLKNNILFGPCIYSNDMKKKLINGSSKNIITLIKNNLSIINNYNNKIISEQEIEKMKKLFYNIGYEFGKIGVFFPFIKNFGFNEENEWRLIYTVSKENKLNLNFRLKNDLVIPYVELIFKNKIPITKIILSPNSEMLLNISSIKLFMQKNNYDIDIFGSDIPFRT